MLATLRLCPEGPGFRGSLARGAETRGPLLGSSAGQVWKDRWFWIILVDATRRLLRPSSSVSRVVVPCRAAVLLCSPLWSVLPDAEPVPNSVPPSPGSC